MGLSEYKPLHNPPLEAPSTAQRIQGGVHRPGMSYRVQLAWDGKRLTGRLGGAILGENLYLEAQGRELLGSLSSSLRAFALHAKLEGNYLQFRRVGAEHGSSASLELSGGRASGWVYLETCVSLRESSEDRAQPVEVEFGPSRLLARIGPDQAVTLHHPGFAAWVLAAAALAADLAARDAWRVLLESYAGWAEA
ncbi:MULTISPECIES: hypothetical protein [unclassified Meiothermus]|uniref:hypothetical protein n=1 Tax=unclassified Meiothermus TaxID=370471 RepID=UPI000D7C8ECA|nr:MULTISPECIES: hypothetical protein [unclassified Meiothermus]PZA07679.1 hypothetical protein DNA98_05010 [Meiothermus sp. Pnk-1]RYM36516.1 hypothetical protein EWH23_09910 [Meiothermus sp. PNK-Is4]